MTAILRPILAFLTARAARLRYPALTAIAAAVFLLDLVIPDIVPLADEILLGLITAALASWKTDRPAKPTHRRAPTPHATA
ncbi:MAG: DUF6116 family protein [Phycisphaerales bacterium]